MRMLAAVLESYRRPLQLVELEIPKLQRGQVLVKIAYSAICRSQLMEIKGQRGQDRWLPHLLGHEASGIVVDTGPGVVKVKPDEEVVLTWLKSNGLEAAPPKYLHRGKTINAGPITTFSTFTIVSENRLVSKPAELRMDSAVLFGCALPTGTGMVLNELDISKRDNIIVLGLGGIGMAALLALKAISVNNVIAVDADPVKCEFAKLTGADAICSVNVGDLKSRVEAKMPDGADYCIEAGGTTDSIELGFSLINPHSGTLLFASHPPTGKKIRLDPHQLIRGKNIRGSWGGGFQPDRDVPMLFTLLQRENISLTPLTRNRYPFLDINKAVADFSAGKIFRPILTMDSELAVI